MATLDSPWHRGVQLGFAANHILVVGPVLPGA